MEAKILLLSENGRKLQGNDICSYNFKLNPPINLSEPSDYFCAMSYLKFMQLNIDYENEISLQVGDLLRDGTVKWSVKKHTIVIMESSLDKLLEKIGKWQESIKQFDGELRVGVEKQEGTGFDMPYAKMFTKKKAVRLSDNLSRLLGFYKNEFAPGISKGEESTISPGWSRWKEGPLLLDVDILEQEGLEHFGQETQLPDGESTNPVRTTYLAIVPLQQEHELQVENVAVEIIRAGPQLQWVRARQCVISHITLNMRWANGEPLFVDSHFRFVCEIILKRRKMLTFA